MAAPPQESFFLFKLSYSQERGSSDCLAFLYYIKHLEATIVVIWLYINKSELTITNIHKKSSQFQMSHSTS